MLTSLKKTLKTSGTVQFYVRVRPHMAHTVVRSLMDDESVKIDVAAPAEGGRANTELVRFIAQEFSVHREHVRILSGASSRVKLVRISQ